MARKVLPLIFLSCLSACTARKDPKSIPVLVVNGQAFSAGEVGHRLALRLKNYDALAAKDVTNIKKAREAIFQELITQALLDQFAKAHNIAPSESEKEAEFRLVRKGYPDDLTFKAALANEGQTLEDWKSDLAESVLEKKVFATLAPLNPEASKSRELEAKKYYEGHPNEFSHPAEIHLQQILLAREDDAERIAHSIKGGANFVEMAKKYSISPDGPKGGDIGFIPKGSVPAFDGAFSLRLGQVSGVVKSSYGFHIMKVLDKRAAGRVPFERVKTRLMRQVEAQEEQRIFNRWLEDAVKAAKIERNDNLLEHIKVRTEAPEE